MSEVFGIQDAPESGQEAKIALKDETGLFNALHDLWLSDWKGHDEIKATIAALKANIDNFNTWVDNKLLLWETILWIWAANDNDQTETYEWADTTTSENFQIVLEAKVNELNSIVQRMIDEYSNDTEGLKQDIWNILWVNSFVASVPKEFLVWDGEVDTPEQVQLADIQEQKGAISVVERNWCCLPNLWQPECIPQAQN